MTNHHLTMQMDDAGNHRLVSSDGKKGEWVRYESFSTLTIHGDLYIAATQYWEGVLPCETPMLARPTLDGKSEVIPGIRPE